MHSYKKIDVQGRITTLDLRKTKSGQSLLTGSLGVGFTKGDKGKFESFKAFAPFSEELHRKIKVGDTIRLQCRLDLDQWEKEDGKGDRYAFANFVAVVDNMDEVEVIEKARPKPVNDNQEAQQQYDAMEG
ncbi:MAG: hypothetical protein COA78_34850 [Blastopirellula sp.]|nr:MAG: hypothetical protein COA78_34850 [Blastopirellula sp.]